MRYFNNKKIVLLIIIYLVATIILTLKNNTIYVNIINPIFWGIMLVYLIWYIKNGHIRLNSIKKYYIFMIIIPIIHVIIYFCLGYIVGFIQSPYNHQLTSILKNIAVEIIPIIGIEVLRITLVIRNKKNKAFLNLITILLIFLEIKYNYIASLSANKEELFKYVCSEIIPLFFLNILYTYLAINGCCILSLLYRIFTRIIVLLSPILPNLDWFMTAAVNIISPVIIYFLFKYKFIKGKKDIRKKKQYFFQKLNYIITIILSVTIIGFMIGIFKYEVISVISNSMSPLFERGDAVIYKKLNNDELKNISEGSIIIYSIGNKNIAHRVVNIIKDNDIILYQTKGDQNNMSDTNLVEINQIKGVYVFCIKYMGFPSVLLYEYFSL